MTVVVGTIPLPEVRVDELGVTTVEMSPRSARQLRAWRICTVQPSATSGAWELSGFTRVGTVQLDDIVLDIVPKAGASAVVHMASRAGMEVKAGNDSIAREAGESLTHALVGALVDEAERLAQHGLRRGYVDAEQSGATVRGRWNIARQLARHPGLPLPVEVDVDEFSLDIAENMIIAGALHHARRIDALSPALRSRLEGASVAFADVAPIRSGVALPTVVFDRRNVRYEPGIRLAAWILESVAWAQRSGPSVGATFLVDMAAVFERFIAVELSAAMVRSGVQVSAQVTTYLDSSERVPIRPDLVMQRGAEVVTVADTKYKVLDGGLADVRNSDVYQALAYAVALGTRSAHLIYAGEEASSAMAYVPGANVDIVVHAVDVTGGPDRLRASIEWLAESMLAAVEDAAAYTA